MAFKLHKKHCGKDNPKPFKCTNCEKCFTRKSTLEDKKHAHQLGGGTKRKAEEEGQQAKRKKLPNIVNGIPPADKETLAMKGTKVDAFFNPKTETQHKDQQVFFKETLPTANASPESVKREERCEVECNVPLHTLHARSLP